jgi:ABC-type transporter MlaC component
MKKKRITPERIAAENIIIARAKELCKEHPDIWVTYGNPNANKTGDFLKIKNLNIITALSLIENIEKEFSKI